MSAHGMAERTFHSLAQLERMELCHRRSVVSQVVDRCCHGREREPVEWLGEHRIQKVDSPNTDGDVRVLRNKYFGRVFPAVGNHEVWGDTDVEGLLTLFPYLKKMGVSDKKFIYSFDYQGVRFIFLWTGSYDEKQPSAWNATQPVYEEQMKQLRAWLDEAKAMSIKKVFISFHAPAFASRGLGPIPEAQNPHKTIAAYAKDLDIVVFNGHVHTTELYQVDGVKYLLLGGGGAEQDPILPGRTHNKVPEGYPKDLYWNGEDPKEDYSYLHVDVIPGQPTNFTLNRFRPWSAQPFEALELFK